MLCYGCQSEYANRQWHFKANTHVTGWRHFYVVQYIPRNMHTVFALLCFVVVIHWLIFSYPSGLLNWHCGNLTIALVPAKQPWWIWKNTSCEFIMNDCITTTKQSTTKPCAYFLGYAVGVPMYVYTHLKLHISKRFSKATKCSFIWSLLLVLKSRVLNCFANQILW